MNFETTSALLEILKPYIENSVVNIFTEDKKDWCNRDYKSDFVTEDYSGLYDTKDKAINSAMEALRCRGNHC